MIFRDVIFEVEAVNSDPCLTVRSPIVRAYHDYREDLRSGYRNDFKEGLVQHNPPTTARGACQEQRPLLGTELPIGYTATMGREAGWHAAGRSVA